MDPTGSSGLSISGFDHLLSFDLDPTEGVTLQSINPFIGAFSGPYGLTIYGDHAFGNLGFGFSADPDLPGS